VPYYKLLVFWNDPHALQNSTCKQTNKQLRVDRFRVYNRHHR